ncbi:MAG: prolipoprotein diacylglyceryl transferase [Rhizobiales bacterium]|nr:prolipoprotein diacylglyceryl transferase [Hyphomicrobiales bacterium]
MTVTILFAAGTLALSALVFVAPDPVAFQIGPLAVRWYGVAYMAGLLIGWFYVRRLVASPRLWADERAPLTRDQVDSLLLWVTFGVVVGGRLGYVLFYNPVFFAQNPLEILSVWKGGMSFHGGLLGVTFALLVFARLNDTSFFSLTDIASAAVPIGLFFGRIANFINGEVYGRPSDVPWAMVFPREVLAPADEVVARHPSQLYEAALEGIVLFLIVRMFTHGRLAMRWPGFVTGVFLIGYGLARGFCELFRAYDPDHMLALHPFVTPGIVYSIPMVLVGAYLVHTRRFKAESQALSAGRTGRSRG